MLLSFTLFFIVVSSGSVSVNADSSVQLLAEEACAIEDIDVQVCYPLFVRTCVVCVAIQRHITSSHILITLV